MTTRLDIKTLGIMALGLALGAIWAAYNLAGAGAVRNDSTVRPLVWAVFATPAALFIGWLFARRREVGLAAACSFSLYFFSFFIAQRIESLVVSPEQAATNGHQLYFVLMIVLHIAVGAGLTLWRAFARQE